MAESPVSRSSVFPTRGSHREVVRIGALLRRESVGGILLVAMAAIALIWSNSPFADSYFALRDLEFGYEPWHLRLSLGAWAADGLLAIFFFLVGLELKREFTVGDLRDIRRAIVPVTAAVGGVVVPAVIYMIIVGPQPELLRGWAVPTATDIAFAVAVLAIIGSHLPARLRLFLLTLAVVDDLIAIVIIAVFYTDDLDPMPIPGAILALALYAVLAQRRRGFFLRNRFAAWLILLPVGIVVWAFVHASGIHATIAGVLLGFMIPVRSHATGDDGVEDAGLAEEFEHRFRPLSAGFAVPVFAFFAAGVAFAGDGLIETITHPVTIAIVCALVLGKPVGIVLTTWLTTRITRSRMSDGLGWIDLIGVGVLAGIGFTVSLLIAELSFPRGVEHDAAKVAILLASVLAALTASVILGLRNRHYRLIEEQDAVDEDADGIPDVYERGE
ncbi:Na+/H+ antiporter NhaA [Microbacterium hydrocarbonoxydans]|uniref:Na+/H+ antiporter NhaA n=1 Tax=Microbacterium hydrocarbonoxydans TaxID=273678 RepID=UPI0007BC4E1B|nr:Na+/H+ antiporter NhaA [Microbacterium hydrocarbonoxydans]GAT74441.1 pH-dependent sodium/proton antiporter [Microbacterium sp. HM58-2]